MNRILLMLGVALAAVAMPARANGNTFYAEVEGWNVYSTAGSDECYMISRFDNDTVTTVFIDTGGNATFWLQNPAWQSLKQNGKYTVDVQFDDMGEWEVSGTGKHDRDGPGLVWNTKYQVPQGDTSFLAEFAVADTMRMTRNGRYVTGIRLTGTYAASMKTLECARKKAPSDPFASGNENAPDPFATGDTSQGPIT